MSVDSYFGGKPDTRMPKNPGGTDELGIRYEGPVLTGLLGVRQAFTKQARDLCGYRESQLPDLGPEVQAGPVPFRSEPRNAADALVSVDPVMQVHREPFGNPPSTTYAQPEQYDPVLRHHLHMPPAPDPYEEQRRREAYRNSRRNEKLV